VTVRDVNACLEILKESTHVLGAGLEESQVIHDLLTQAVALLAGRGALVRLLSPDGDQLLLAGAQGLSEAYLDKGAVLVSHSQVDQRALAGEVVKVPDMRHEPGVQYPDEAAAEGLRGMVVVPLQVRDHSIGVLRVYVDRLEALDAQDIGPLHILANLGAVVLEKVRLHTSLYHIAAALNTSLELKPVLNQVLETTVREMWLKAASIRLLDEKGQTLQLAAATGLSQAYLAKGDVHLAKSPTDQWALRGEPVVLYDVARETGFEYPAEAAREGIRSVLVVALKLRDRNLGVMRVYSARPRHFGPVAITFLTSVADLVALAIEKAGLYAALQDRYENLKLDLADWYRFLALG
jgi:signal transduction protein with GAF and PtsI domain